MMRSMIVVCVIASVGMVTMATAEEGVPSQHRLKHLGLSELQVSPDSAGYEVRGSAFGAMNVNFLIPLAPPVIQAPVQGRLVFGNDNPPQSGFTYDAQLGTAQFTTDPVTGATTVNVIPFEASTTTFVNGNISVLSYTFQGNLFARGN